MIGQGAIQVTPLQIARAMSAVVDGGILRPLSIVKDQSLKYKGEETLTLQLPFSDQHLRAVKEGMFAVVNTKGGTAHRSALPEESGILMAGKTATAQIKSSKLLKGEDSENHAWFAGFAPYENPEIVVVAIVEHGGHGGATAAPVVKSVMEEFFKINDEQQKEN